MPVTTAKQRKPAESLAKVEKEVEAMRKRLDELSPFVRKQFAEIVREAKTERKKGAIDDIEMAVRLQKAADEFSRHAESEGALMGFLMKESIELRAEIPKETDAGRRSRLEGALAQIEADLRELKTFARMREIESRLSAKYVYMPSVMMEDVTKHEMEEKTRDLVRMIRNRNVGQAGREKAVGELERTLERYESYLNSPSKAKDFLRNESFRVEKEVDEYKAWLEAAAAPQERARVATEIRKLDARFEMISADSEKAQSMLESSSATAAKMRVCCRFTFDEYTVTSTQDGSGVRLISDVHGNDVVFYPDATLVVTADGTDALFGQDGKFQQVRTAKGETVQLADGKMVRVCDAEGNWLFTEPDAPRKFAVIRSDGSMIIDKGELAEFKKRFDPIMRFYHQESGKFTEVLNTAIEMKISPDVKKKLDELATKPVPQDERPINAEDVPRAVEKLKAALVRTDCLSKDGKKFKKDAFEAGVRVLLPSTAAVVAGAIRTKHPAHIELDLSKVLMLETDEKPQMSAGERDELYARVFVVKAGRDYISVLLLHSKLVDVIRGGEYERLGRLVYDDVIAGTMEDLRVSKLRVLFELALSPNGKVCSEIKRAYGEKFFSAMLRKDYGEMGTQELFDRLIHEGTIALVRPRTRKAAEDAQARVLPGDEEAARKSAQDYLTVRMGDRRSEKKLVKRIIWLYRKLYNDEYLLDLPVGQLALKRRIDDLKEDFFGNPSEETYAKFQKAAEFREIIRSAPDRARAILAVDGKESEPLAKEQLEKYKRDFKAAFELMLIENRGLAADEAVAIAMQSSMYHRRTVPTCHEIYEYLRELAHRLGAEDVLNAVRGEETPADIVRAAKKLERISKTYNTDYMKARMERARKEELKEEAKEALEIIEKVISLGRTAAGAG